jgi:hypothetical protein
MMNPWVCAPVEETFVPIELLLQTSILSLGARSLIT